MSPWFWTSYALLWLAVIIQGVLILALGRAFSSQAEKSVEGRSRRYGPRSASDAPPLGGPEVRTADLQGELPSIVVFVASGCSSCRAARPTLSWFAQRYGHLVQIVVSCRGQRSDVEEFFQAVEGPIRGHHDEAGENAKAWNVRRVSPFAVSVDRRGLVTEKRARLALKDLEILLKSVQHGDLVLSDRPMQVPP